jgi:hypothetical protein
MTTTRTDIVRTARTYLGTPFGHMQRDKGVSIDCAGLLICTARELSLVAPDFDVPPYPPVPDGTLLDKCREFMRPISRAEMQPGDAVLLTVDRDPQHLAILADYRYGGLSIIHAANTTSQSCVIETRLLFAQNQKFVAAFAFPGIW